MMRLSLIRMAFWSGVHYFCVSRLSGAPKLALLVCCVLRSLSGIGCGPTSGGLLTSRCGRTCLSWALRTPGSCLAYPRRPGQVPSRSSLGCIPICASSVVGLALSPSPPEIPCGMTSATSVVLLGLCSLRCGAVVVEVLHWSPQSSVALPPLSSSAGHVQRRSQRWGLLGCLVRRSGCAAFWKVAAQLP